MVESLRQRFRQPFGYFMEDLIRDHFSNMGLLCLGHNYNNIYECEDWIIEDSITSLMQFYDCLKHSKAINIKNFELVRLNKFNTEHKEIDYKKIKLTIISSLLKYNIIEG